MKIAVAKAKYPLINNLVNNFVNGMGLTFF